MARWCLAAKVRPAAVAQRTAKPLVLAAQPRGRAAHPASSREPSAKAPLSTRTRMWVHLRMSEAQRCRVHSTLMAPEFG